ncbi:very short patch repair endonuclease [Acetobacter sp. AN02]|uniref:very short patch repair endonuclease n=1 Tax=Acetobacter sp. AN02 TaxID=2894186 RepID=UPI0024342650|nr:very short patch repair endonuclease [Acetobacter sp. AN02]MDG6094197.1 very short patch repair endonuclease [Acetobacter sp. AN02]
MTDVHDAQTRRRNMAAVRGKDTKPEMSVRQMLFAAGFRYRLHGRGLPGKPDLVFPKYRAVIFVHGCFWHHHDCHLFCWPGTREEFWRTKIARNELRDRQSAAALREAGWRVAVVWECALKGRSRLAPDETGALLADWLRSDRAELVVQGTSAGVA